MKKLFSSFLLVIFLLVWFFSFHLESFSMWESNYALEEKTIHTDCCKEEFIENYNNNCRESCCFSAINFSYYSLVTNNSNNPIKKLKSKTNLFISLLIFDPDFSEILISKDYIYPDYKKYSKFYSYKDLVKIVKSNT